MPRTDLQAAGERELRERLLREREVQLAIEKVAKLADQQGARRYLLASATRLTADMAPELHSIAEACRTALGVVGAIELFVYPDPTFNAAAVRPERGRLLMMVSSSLLEAFNDDELKFVIGHEVGHFLFAHHEIPVSLLLGRTGRVSGEIALRLFSWQRYAEISADRAGLVAAGNLHAAAHALFKLASGLGDGRIKVRIDQFLAQMGDLQAEAEQLPDTQDGPARSDWFATHPFSPLRLKAATLFASSETFMEGGRPLAEVESEVEELMTIMDPSYLRAPTAAAEAMRRLLFAAGVAIAAVSGQVQAGLGALERLLGPGSVPPEVNPRAIAADLSRRIRDVRDLVPPLRRAQLVRDLCVIARADGYVSDAELAIMHDIAQQIGIDRSLVTCSMDPHATACALGPAEDARPEAPGSTSESAG